ncbi:hypothetical protein ElyMa_003175200 [Elysia marginata]|uniref:Uncharacterized protein n=1 Tax=Elysia marginata TaxID=1093978 RepID=A0AAV4IX43_9GAST|nr:hypothetical protein ElyMa_003175200 [Elysia marginata]
MKRKYPVCTEAASVTLLPFSGVCCSGQRFLMTSSCRYLAAEEVLLFNILHMFRTHQAPGASSSPPLVTEALLFNILHMFRTHQAPGASSSPVLDLMIVKLSPLNTRRPTGQQNHRCWI